MREDFRKTYCRMSNWNAYTVVVDTLVLANGAITLTNNVTSPRSLDITTTDTGGGITGGTLTITGTDCDDVIVTETFTLVELKTTTQSANCYKKITSMVIAGLAGTGSIIIYEGNKFQFTKRRGVLKAIVIESSSFGAGTISVIDGTSGTTPNVAKISATAVEKTYKFNCIIANGLRIVLNTGTFVQYTPLITVIYQ